MNEERAGREDDQDPQPVKESDAERVSGDQAADPEEIENDPAQSPADGTLRDVKGG